MRNTIIDNLRGICMLGVIGIHIGSLALAPNNFTLYLLLEILSRYSVPSFFFISGYGLACTDKGLLSGSQLNYIDFMKKRLRGAGLPYLSWSLFYMLYFWLILPPGFVSWNPLHVAYVLFFGLGCYHLYFMVILLWFYASYPLWRQLLRIIIHQSIPFMLVLLFIFQLAFNWWTTHPGLNTAGWSVLAKNFFDYRLNYLPLHYLLIFISGGLAACYWEKFIALLRRYSAMVHPAHAAGRMNCSRSTPSAFCAPRCSRCGWGTNSVPPHCCLRISISMQNLLFCLLSRLYRRGCKTIQSVLKM